MRIEHREDETHSILLEDLLSPNGSHGQKGLFLELFLKQIEDKFKINTKNANLAKVKREHSIGKIDEKYLTGGRIDILIEINNELVIIENKLYAKDQPFQLQRYQHAFPKAKILYLTIDGSDYENKDFITNYHSISYEKTITQWLEAILEKISDKQYLYNSITQYYNLVKNISFTGFTQEMKKEISNEITASTENLEAAYQIYKNYESAIRKLVQEKVESLRTEMKSIDYERVGNSSELNSYFTKENWQQHNICVGLEFEKNTFFIGITYIDYSKPINEDFNIKVKQKFSTHNSTDYWPTFEYLQSFSNIYSPETSKLFFDGEFNRVIKESFEDYGHFLDKVLK